MCFQTVLKGLLHLQCLVVTATQLHQTLAQPAPPSTQTESSSGLSAAYASVDPDLPAAPPSNASGTSLHNVYAIFAAIQRQSSSDIPIAVRS